MKQMIDNSILAGDRLRKSGKWCKFRRVVLFLILVNSYLLTSCELLFMEDEYNTDPFVNFNFLWQQLDEKYTFFEYKKIDWDSVYNVFYPKLSSDMDDYELYQVMRSMLSTLHDGHTNLVVPYYVSPNNSSYPNSFDLGIIKSFYLGNDYSTTGPFIYKEIEGIGYVYYSSFIDPLDDEDVDIVLDSFKNSRGLIIDVRNNGGGLLSTVDLFGSHLLPSGTAVEYGYYMNKTGPGKDDYTNKLPLTIESVNKKVDNQRNVVFTGDIVLLTNRHSYSATNFFTMFMNTLDYVTIVGDTTGGGGGIPSDYQLPNGWTFRFSSSRTFTLDDENIEGGIVPDIIVINSLIYGKRKDDVLEKALSLFK